MPYGRLSTNPQLSVELVELFRHQLSMSRLRSGEECLIVTDTAFDPTYASACLGAALALGASAQVVTLPYAADELPRSFGATVGMSDLLVGMTTHPLHYRDDVREALDGGSRALLAVQPLHVARRLPADADVIARTKSGARRLAHARSVRIHSPHGTDLVMDTTDRPTLAHYGAADEPGHFDFWGGAMVETAQHEGTLQGTLVLNTGDVVFHLGRFVEHPVALTFDEGRLVDVEGGLDAFLLREHLASYDDPNAFMAGHIAWGTDHRALWTAPLIQFPEAGAGNADSEGYYGNVQVQIGSNDDRYFRGTNRSRAHLGLCMLDTSVDLDGETVIDTGTIVDAPIERVRPPWS